MAALLTDGVKLDGLNFGVERNAVGRAISHVIGNQVLIVDPPHLRPYQGKQDDGVKRRNRPLVRTKVGDQRLHKK